MFMVLGAYLISYDKLAKCSQFRLIATLNSLTFLFVNNTCHMVAGINIFKVLTGIEHSL